MIPDSLKLMLIYILGSLRHAAFTPLNYLLLLDEKVFKVYKFMHLSFNMMPYIFYPRVYCITDLVGVIGNQRTYGDIQKGLNWGFFTDESESSIVKPKVIQS